MSNQTRSSSNPAAACGGICRNWNSAKGDAVILHSSFKSLGTVDGGPNTVIDALLDAVGSHGHLLVPTFTYSLPMWHVEPFDPKTSKARVGVIPEVLRQRPDAHRSFHPTHSVAVIGPHAEDIIRNHLHATPLGADCPFDRMRKFDAKILMLGTFQDTNSSLHLCEVLAGLPYVRVAFTEGQDFEIAWFINEDGQVEYTQFFEVPGCSRGFSCRGGTASPSGSSSGRSCGAFGESVASAERPCKCYERTAPRGSHHAPVHT